MPGSARTGRSGLGQTADFHYTLQPTSSDHHFRPSQSQGRVLRQESPYQNLGQQGGGYQSPHVTQVCVQLNYTTEFCKGLIKFDLISLM